MVKHANQRVHSVERYDTARYKLKTLFSHQQLWSIPDVVKTEVITPGHGNDRLYMCFQNINFNNR